MFSYCLPLVLLSSFMHVSHSKADPRSIRFGANGVAKALSFVGGAQHDDEYRTRRKEDAKEPIISTFAKKSMAFTGKAISATAKQSGKAAYWAVRPKSVDLEELVGLWRMDQQVILYAEDGPVESISNVEFTPRHIYVVLDGEKKKTPLRFVSAKFPKSARVEFVAKAFQLEGEKPSLFFYRGYIHRKLADTSVLKIKGKIYRITRTGFRGKTIKHVEVGTFVARKRMKFADDVEGQDDKYDEEYGDYTDGVEFESQ